MDAPKRRDAGTNQKELEGVAGHPPQAVLAWV